MKKANTFKSLILVTLTAFLASCNSPASDDNNDPVKEEHTHTYSKNWSKDETSHWHADTCGHNTISDKANHTLGEWTTFKAATETAEGEERQYCSVCEYYNSRKTEKIVHTHTYGTDWSKNADGHWHAATCGHNVKSGEASHTYGEWQTKSESTESVAGYKERVCSVCGYVNKENLPLKEHVHTYSSDWSKSSEKHWHAATCDHPVKQDEAVHTFGNWITTKNPTETEVGSKERVCSVCEYVEKEEIPVLQHTHTYSSEWEKDSTQHWHAATCAHDVKDSLAPHDFGNWTTTQEPSETVEGSKQRVCETCGYVDIEVLPVLSHTHTFNTSAWESNETQHWHAATCGHDVKDSLATHDFGNWTTTKEPSETEVGHKQRVCETCSYVDEEDIEMLAHTHKYADEWTSDDTQHWHASTCGHDVAKDKGDHDWSGWTVNTEPTVISAGSKSRYCLVCEKVQEEEIPAIVPEQTYTVADYYNGYYSPIVSWENGADLKSQLHDLISTGFTGLTYASNWETNQNADRSVDDFTKVNVVYSQRDELVNGNNGAVTGGWQREHAFCASLMTGYNTGDATGVRNSGTSRATDFHNLFAAYGAANGGRGNKNLGNVDHDNLYESNATYADSYSDTVSYNYEPNDCDKGRLARAIFYMGVMYSEEETSMLSLTFNYTDVSNKSKSKTVPVEAKYKPIQIVEDYVNYSAVTFNNFVSGDAEEYQALRDTYYTPYMGEGGSTAAFKPTSIENDSAEATTIANFAKAYADYRYATCQFAIGNLSTLIDWSNNTDVDRQEMWHNESVCNHVYEGTGANNGKKQGNRNPFIDYPELVDYIYGDKQDEPGVLAYLRPAAEDLETNSNGLYGFVLSSYKDSYMEGETFTADDVVVKRVNKDFSISEDEVDMSSVEPHTFANNDIGTFTISFNVGGSHIEYPVTVESAGGVNACNYRETITKNSFSVTSLNTTTQEVLTLGDMTYKVTAGNTCEVKTSGDNVQVGVATSGKQALSLTIESSTPFNYGSKFGIKSIYIGARSASGKSYSIKISVGDTEVYSGSIVYNGGEFDYYGTDLDATLQGVIKIEITGVNAALYLSELAVKTN